MNKYSKLMDLIYMILDEAAKINAPEEAIFKTISHTILTWINNVSNEELRRELNNCIPKLCEACISISKRYKAAAFQTLSNQN